MSTPTPPDSDPYDRPADQTSHDGADESAAASAGPVPGPSYIDPTLPTAVMGHSSAAPAPTPVSVPPIFLSKPYPPAGAATRRNRRRKALAVVAAGSLLAAVVGLSSSYVGATSVADTSSATTEGTTGTGSTGSGSTSTDPSGGSSSGGITGPGSGSLGRVPGSSGGYGSGLRQTSTVDSQPATTAEQQGVALIDTVLANGEAAGSGIVLTPDGEILTNYHVVEGSTSIRVTIASTGKAYSATVVGHDQAADVALLQLKDASGLTVATIDTDTAGLGDTVTAVGNAGGTGELTAADGTITDLSTSITTESEDSVQGEKLQGLIETSADVVAGDSGGPLLDAQGEVIGIDTAASSGSEINGYAVPIDDALAVVTQILTGTETSAVQIGPAAFLGVELSQSDENYGGTEGVTIAGTTSGGAAAEAGLAAGDTVTKVGGTTVGDSSELSAAIATHEPGDRVRITWTTDSGDQKSATVTLGSSPVN